MEMPDEPPRDYSDDFTISISDEVASSPLAIGDFIEVVALIQNRMNDMAMAVLKLASEDHKAVGERLLESIETGKEINRRLDELAGNVGRATRGD